MLAGATPADSRRYGSVLLSVNTPFLVSGRRIPAEVAVLVRAPVGPFRHEVHEMPASRATASLDRIDFAIRQLHLA
jgi:hypothetical protein